MNQPERISALAAHINEILTKLPNAYVGQPVPVQRGMWRQLELCALATLENLCATFDVSGGGIEELKAKSRRALERQFHRKVQHKRRHK